MFSDEKGGVRMMIESQSQPVGRPYEDMKKSSASSFGDPGSHVLFVVPQGLKKHKHKFTAKLAHHDVEDELRMQLLTLRCQTDRNTPTGHWI
jgi:hypothetical protein